MALSCHLALFSLCPSTYLGYCLIHPLFPAPTACALAGLCRLCVHSLALSLSATVYTCYCCFVVQLTFTPLRYTSQVSAGTISRSYSCHLPAYLAEIIFCFNSLVSSGFCTNQSPHCVIFCLFLNFMGANKWDFAW